MIITPADNDTSIKIEETDHPIVEYKTFHNGDFLSKEGVLMTKNLPVLNLGAGMGPESSTLFCPNGIELVDEEIKVLLNSFGLIFFRKAIWRMKIKETGF